MAARPADPKVVLVVGPVGGLTDEYRALADRAASVARKYTDNVVKVYSPNATWPVVTEALEGASIVVYLGHGNGWPSRYRDALYPPSQNGFGLNPIAGVDDANHQYFGEGPLVESGVRLAKNAIVLLHHLCYASGNTEPGLPEGTLADAQQRVDNYAAGFLSIGARAVVAEGHMGPAWYVRQLLSTNKSIERIWQTSPTFNGNLLAFDSMRSPGFVAHMDPERGDSGFYRSLVVKSGLKADRVRGGAPASAANASGLALVPAEPTLVGSGVVFEAPTLVDPPAAGTHTTLRLPAAIPTRDALGKALMLGVRWDPLQVAPKEVDAGETASSDGPTAGEEPGADTTSGPEQTADPAEPATLDPASLVQPEVAGSVVAAAKAKREKGRLAVGIDLPNEPGFYRLVTTLHDSEGVAFDAETQDLLPALLVHVTGPLAARYEVPASLTVAAGESVEIDVAVTNVGSSAWGTPTAVDPRRSDDRKELFTPNQMIARWIGLDGDALNAPETGGPIAQDVGSGDTIETTLDLAIPAVAGNYLLLIDVVTPEHGSLAAAGVEPALVRVSVVPRSELPAPDLGASPGG